jgi:hypothetical protein
VSLFVVVRCWRAGGKWDDDERTKIAVSLGRQCLCLCPVCFFFFFFNAYSFYLPGVREAADQHRLHLLDHRCRRL